MPARELAPLTHEFYIWNMDASRTYPPKARVLETVSVDVVIFTLRGPDLQVCLVRRDSDPYKGYWSLPGGAVVEDETLEDAAMRLLHNKTGVSDVYLQQLFTFSAPERDPRRRVISVAYFALISAEQLSADHLDENSETLGWHNVYNLPPLAFDHAEIVDYALTRLRYKIEYSAVAFELMPREFTLRELQDAYMNILDDHTLDKANFRKKIREADILEEADGYRETGGRPAKLYRFRKDAQLEVKARRIFP
jgi:8-oxo-dGTP diphosphatase